MNIAIVIPARFASTRFPGKPLAMLGGQAMLSRVYQTALKASDNIDNVEVVVATDDGRISSYCEEENIPFVLTSPDCPTGTDRVMEAVTKLDTKPDFVVNLQGDAPFTPWDFVRDVIDDYIKSPDTDVITPVTRLSWEQLDKLRDQKLTNPFSGTTAILDKDRNALWFSKSIIPAIRKEDKLRALTEISPVYRHIGLYAYSLPALEKYVDLDEGSYEALEGLEQLRLLENNMRIRAVIVDYKDRPAMSGVDTPDDLARAEELLKDFDEV
ncbi:MAG: 3-deoxy-manno-octulosonate cytidylyltransferase [Micavibrio sp.]|nr:3-deoxy-manno-octulosonate cytidylyltransferase [Micavibrio sp.]